jgi:lipopolysaccharide export system protein LptA
LHAGELTVELDTDYHVQRVVARPELAGQQVEVRSSDPRGLGVLTANEFVTYVHPAGWIERAQANGAVHASMTRDVGEDSVSAAEMEMQFLPGQNQPQQIVVSGGVTALTNRNGRLQRLETAALRLNFVKGTGKARPELDHAEALAPATLEWQVPGGAGQPPLEITKLVGQQLSAEFAARGLLKILLVKNGLNIERRVPDRPIEFSSAREALVKFDPGGEWAEVNEDGDVRAREGNNSAQADHARIDRAADVLTLTGSVDVTDGEIRMTSQSATFNQRTAEFRADTNVHTTYLKSGAGSVAILAPQPAFLVSDRLDGNSSGGRATFTGHARLWQGESVIEADSIEIIRDAQRLTAQGKVAAAFIQQSGSNPVPQLSQARAQSKKPDLWRIRAATLTYWSAEQRALMDGGVTADSSQAGIASKTLELLFSPAVPQSGTLPVAPRIGMPVANPANLTGPLQISKVTASGGVVVKQDDRKGTSDRAIYDAAEQKFVLTGGNPTIYDGPRGTTSGRQLTFFFANDTIVVDSEEGSRTLTRHRVEK